MGFHICEYEHGSELVFPITSSGDVTLVFSSGRAWEMPDMIMHYVADHGWLPPQEFIDDVMNSEYVGGRRLQTKGLVPTTRIGYLQGPFQTGSVPEGFVLKLQGLMRQAEEAGLRKQYRSLDC